ncbi:hypothetical protein PEL8287_02631 [Roseovarius litorisediminis]|uniref:DUF302 domain-containing protein n=1 Tax=Roseovarius litorisediminis TaxID=1312363 RepID=A0A1Y5T261_9RHOB|nr:DUF302 domain-containing protein [Roseovarius litorisediminis]SLN50455.1 hypothetical protein PEL8287_02631 [Roseovarius litorisediminis]
MKTNFLAGVIALMAVPVFAGDVATVYKFDGAFEDATFAVENAIVGHGLVIDFTSHVGEMLNRTAADVGSDVEVFTAADIFLFCSAQLSREVMEADAMNIVHCPYKIFVTDRGGDVEIGYPNYPDGVMQKVQALSDEIVKKAME